MNNHLWEDIQAQSDNLRHVIDHLYGAEYGHLKEASRLLRNDRPVVFIGMASAAYVCMPAEYYLGQRGRFASTFYASDAFYNLLPALKRANVVINSRSGETAEIVKLSQALEQAGIPFVAVTNEPNSTLAQRAGHVVWCDSRKDDLVSINIVTAMMAASLILAAELVGAAQVLRSDLDGLAAALGDTVDHAVLQADRMARFFDADRPIYLLYRGASKGAANCGRLVLEEVARRPAIALDAAEFRQGPIEVVDEDFAAIIFVPAGPVGQLTLSLARDIQNNGGRVIVVGGREAGLTETESAMAFSIAGASPDLHPLLEVIPVQLLAYKLAERQGFQPGSVRYLSRVITAEVGIPRSSE